MDLRVNFYPFSEVVDDHQNKYVYVACFGIVWPYDI
jgi:hypothetical protein